MSTTTIDKPKILPPDTWPPDDDGGGGGGGGGGDGSGPPDSGPPIKMGRLAVYFVLAMVVMLFAGFLSGYVILRFEAKTWPPPGFPRVPDKLWLSTAVILLSSFAGSWAVRAARQGAWRALSARLFVTWCLGCLFCVTQAVLWQHLARHGQTPRSDMYAANFYVLTGLHVAHVIGGIVYLSLCLARCLTGRRSEALKDSVSNCMLYWHFVGAIWLVLFAVFYPA